MRWLVLALVVACSKSEAPPAPVEDKPPLLPPAELQRADAACGEYIVKVCACAETVPAKQEACALSKAIPEAIAALKSGKLLATADFDAYKIACIAAEAAVRFLRGLPVPHEILLPVQIVDRSNYGPWDKPIEERDRPDWAAVVSGQGAPRSP